MKTQADFAKLADRNRGETAVLLSNGPSLADLSDADLKRVCDGRVVIAVKQAIVRYAAANYHLLNHVRLAQYDYVTARPTVLYCGSASLQPRGVDYAMGVLDCGDADKSLVIGRDWDRCLFSRQYGRQFGPGIVLELAVPLALHLGVSRLITIGWDASTAPHAVAPDATKPSQWEHDATVAASGDYYHWLLTRGLCLQLLSRRSMLSAVVPRVTLQEAIQ